MPRIKHNNFGPAFDLVAEVCKRRDELSGEAFIQLHGCPAYASTVWRRVRKRALPASMTKLPKGASFAACILHGIDRLYASESVKRYSRVINELEEADDLSARGQVEIDRYRQSWRFTPKDPHSGSKKMVFRCAEEVKSQLFGLADELGLSGSTLGAVTLMAGLGQQRGVHPDHAVLMKETFNELEAEITERAKQLEAMFLIYTGSSD